MFVMLSYGGTDVVCCGSIFRDQPVLCQGQPPDIILPHIFCGQILCHLHLYIGRDPVGMVHCHFLLADFHVYPGPKVVGCSRHRAGLVYE